jgi:4-azaleucine resistance transporter AzlC
MNGAAREFGRGVIDILPLSVGTAAYGLAFGFLAAEAHMDGLTTGLMGALVYAGSSQIVAVERLVSGSGAIAALIAGLALNLRLVLITASLRDELGDRPFWQTALGAHLSADENWALMNRMRRAGETVGYPYLIGGGVNQMAFWLASTVAGAVFARSVVEPRALGLDFAFTAAFIAILAGLWRGRSDLLPWAAAAAVTGLLILCAPIDPSWSLIAGGVAGAGVAAALPDA